MTKAPSEVSKSIVLDPIPGSMTLEPIEETKEEDPKQRESTEIVPATQKPQPKPVAAPTRGRRRVKAVKPKEKPKEFKVIVC
mgnify:CR=1 FL=1